MEKASNKNKKSTKLSKMFQKAMTISHSAAPFSPGHDFHQHRTKSTANRGVLLSSPLVPSAARVRQSTKTEAVLAEPTSPEVSCIGQIKHAKPRHPEEKNKAPKNLKEEKVSFSKLKRLLSTRKSNSFSVPAESEYPAAVAAAPSLGEMKKFASSREALGEFDWTVQMRLDGQESQTDNRRGFYTDDDEDLEIPCSVTIPLIHYPEALSLCPESKSEVNLWKRRSMDRPKPLQVKPTS